MPNAIQVGAGLSRPHAKETRLVQPYYTVSEAARELEITNGAIYIAMKQGRLRWHYEGGHKVINVKDVEAYPRSVQAETHKKRRN